MRKSQLLQDISEATHASEGGLLNVWVTGSMEMNREFSKTMVMNFNMDDLESSDSRDQCAI